MPKRVAHVKMAGSQEGGSERRSTQLPPRRLVAEAINGNYDLLVLGNKGMQGIGRFAGGQRAEQGVAHVAVRAAHRPHDLGASGAGRALRSRSPSSSSVVVKQASGSVSTPTTMVVVASSRSVTLDPDAQKLVGDLTGKLRVDDLTKAGWNVVGPEKVGEDVRITATKSCSSPAGAERAVRGTRRRRRALQGLQGHPDQVVVADQDEVHRDGRSAPWDRVVQ